MRFWFGFVAGAVVVTAGIAVAGFAHAVNKATELKRRAASVTGDAEAAEAEPAVGGDDAVVA